MAASSRRANLLVGLLALLLALFLLLQGGWNQTSSGLWAFSFLQYVPPALRFLLAALVLISPYIVLLAGGDEAQGWPDRLQRLPLWPVALAGGLIFWLLRERTYHGDALLKLKLLSTETLATDPYVWKEPLDSFLAYTTVTFLRALALPPEAAVALLSVTAGVLYLWSALYLSRLLGRTAWSGAVILVALLAVGSSQLWFGHIENYSLVTAVSFFATALAVGNLRRKLPLWPVGLAAGAAVSLHPQALFTLPAMLLLLDREGWPRQVATLALTGLIAPLVTVLLLWGAGAPLPFLSSTAGNGYAGDSQLFWTLGQAVAPTQLWQAINNLWLLVPLFPLWMVAGIWALLDARTRRDRVLRYLSVLAAGLLLYFFTFQNDLPRWRDWDLYAIVGPGVTLWGVYAWLALMHVQQDRRAWLWPLLTVCLVFASVLTAAWIGVNARYTLIHPTSEERAIYQRYQIADLLDALPLATVTPADPICGEATGCERVMATEFTMPHSGDTRPTLFAHAPARITLPLDVPRGESFLWLGPALDPQAWAWGGDGVTFTVAVDQGDQIDVLWSQHFTPDEPAHRDWQQAIVPLDAYGGQAITLILETSPGPAGNDAGDRAGWGMPWLMRGTYDERFTQDQK